MEKSMNKLLLMEALDSAVKEAIRKVGIATFKKTSLFMSSQAVNDVRAAA